MGRIDSTSPRALSASCRWRREMTRGAQWKCHQAQRGFRRHYVTRLFRSKSVGFTHGYHHAVPTARKTAWAVMRAGRISPQCRRHDPVVAVDAVHGLRRYGITSRVATARSEAVQGQEGTGIISPPSQASPGDAGLGSGHGGRPFKVRVRAPAEGPYWTQPGRESPWGRDILRVVAVWKSGGCWKKEVRAGGHV